MNSTSQIANEAAGAPRTTGGELLAASWQLGVLGMLTVAVLVGIVFVATGGRRLAQLRSEVERRILQSHASVSSREAQAKARLESIVRSLPPPTKVPTATELEQIAKSVATSGPAVVVPPGQATGQSTQVPPNNGSTPPTVSFDEPSNVVPAALLEAIKPGNWGGTNAIIDPLKRLGEFEQNRAAIRDACMEMLDAGQAGPRECSTLIDLAIAWDDKRFADSIVLFASRSPARFAGAAMFDSVARLAVIADKEQVAAVLPALANARMTRQGGSQADFSTIIPQHATFASLAPADSPVFARHVAENSPAGDIVRGALALKDHWPDAVVRELSTVFSNPEHPFRLMLLIWLDQCPRPPAVADALQPFALRLINRQDDGDVSDELFGIYLITIATRAESAGRIATGAARLAEANPEVAKQLLFMLLLGYPQQTVPVFIQAAEAGKPILPPDLSAACWAAERAKTPARNSPRLPGLSLAPIQDRVDAVVAPALAGAPPRDWQRGLVIFAGDWGGPVTLGILRNADKSQVSAAQLTELVQAAQEKIASRVSAPPKTPGEAQ